jgi:hypothetical protein
MRLPGLCTDVVRRRGLCAKMAVWCVLQRLYASQVSSGSRCKRIYSCAVFALWSAMRHSTPTFLRLEPMKQV